jgi:hypothetical protein
MDLVGRKMMDGGEAAFRLLDEVTDAAQAAQPSMPDLATPVWEAAEALREATTLLAGQDMQDRFAGAMPYLNAFARVLGASYHLAAAVAGDDARKALARIYITRVLPRHAADLAEARAGVEALNDVPDAAFAGAA